MNRRMGRTARLIAVAAALATILVVPATAAGAIEPNVEGLATFVDECGGATSLITLELEGSFDGCLYTDEITQAKFRPDGVYIEHGFETIVGCLDTPAGQKCGTLQTSYEYVATFDAEGTQLTGGCTHPIIGGSGDFAGASGIIVFRDDLAAGTADFRGVIELP